MFIRALTQHQQQNNLIKRLIKIIILRTDMNIQICFIIYKSIIIYIDCDNLFNLRNMEKKNNKNTQAKIKKYAMNTFTKQVNESLIHAQLHRSFCPSDVFHEDAQKCNNIQSQFLRVDDNNKSVLCASKLQKNTMPEKQETKKQKQFFQSLSDNKILAVFQEKIKKKREKIMEDNHNNLRKMQQSSEAFNTGPLQKQIQKLRSFRIQREKKVNSTMLLKKQREAFKEQKNKTARKYNKIKKGNSPRNTAIDNHNMLKSSSKYKSLKKIIIQPQKNHVNPHFIEMEIWVDPQPVCNGIRRLPSVKIDKNILNGYTLRTNKKVLNIFSQKNTFEPIFRTNIKQKNQDFNKQEFNKKFELFMGTQQKSPIKLSHSEHIKMKQMAYKKKQQENLFKVFRHCESDRSKNDSASIINIKDEESENLRGQLDQSKFRWKKQINIENLKNYEQLIRDDSYHNIKQKTCKTRKGLRKIKEQSKSQNVSPRRDKKVFFKRTLLNSSGFQLSTFHKNSETNNLIMSRK